MMSTGATSPSILVVEDDLYVRETTADLLSLTGADVHTAASGQEALRLLEGLPVSLVVTDLSMPNGDGNWLIGKIGAGLQAGTDDYVVKPFDPARFLAAVGKYLQPPPSDLPVQQESV